MLRYVSLACLGLGLVGCSNSTVTVENVQAAQSSSTAVAAQAAAPQSAAASPPVRTVLTSTAQMATAHEIVWHKTTTAGATLTLASPASLAADCSPLGPVEVKVLTPPQHGVVHVQPGKAFPHYVPGDPPYACNGEPRPATIVTYRATSGYVGEDTTKVQIFFPDGDAPMVLFHIAVE